MAWVTPIINWGPAYNTPKDFDFNRIEGNAQFLYDWLGTQQIQLDQNSADIADLQAYMQNVPMFLSTSFTVDTSDVWHIVTTNQPTTNSFGVIVQVTASSIDNQRVTINGSSSIPLLLTSNAPVSANSLQATPTTTVSFVFLFDMIREVAFVLSGTTIDYNKFTNKPQIADIVLEGNVNPADFNISSEEVIYSNPALPEITTVSEALDYALSTDGLRTGDLYFTGRTDNPGNTFIPCNGQSLAIQDYPNLFAAIGTTYGAVQNADIDFNNLIEIEIDGTNTADIMVIMGPHLPPRNAATEFLMLGNDGTIWRNGIIYCRQTGQTTAKAYQVLTDTGFSSGLHVLAIEPKTGDFIYSTVGSTVYAMPAETLSQINNTTTGLYGIPQTTLLLASSDYTGSRREGGSFLQKLNNGNFLFIQATGATSDINNIGGMRYRIYYGDHKTQSYEAVTVTSISYLPDYGKPAEFRGVCYIPVMWKNNRDPYDATIKYYGYRIFDTNTKQLAAPVTIFTQSTDFEWASEMNLSFFSNSNIIIGVPGYRGPGRGSSIDSFMSTPQVYYYYSLNGTSWSRVQLPFITTGNILRYINISIIREPLMDESGFTAIYHIVYNVGSNPTVYRNHKYIVHISNNGALTTGYRANEVNLVGYNGGVMTHTTGYLDGDVSGTRTMFKLTIGSTVGTAVATALGGSTLYHHTNFFFASGETSKNMKMYMRLNTGSFLLPNYNVTMPRCFMKHIGLGAN